MQEFWQPWNCQESFYDWKKLFKYINLLNTISGRATWICFGLVWLVCLFFGGGKGNNRKNLHWRTPEIMAKDYVPTLKGEPPLQRSSIFLKCTLQLQWACQYCSFLFLKWKGKRKELVIVRHQELSKWYFFFFPSVRATHFTKEQPWGMQTYWRNSLFYIIE